MKRLTTRFTLFAICIIACSSATAQLTPDMRTALTAYKQKDFTTSLAYFLKAANEGNRDAMYSVAGQYARGEGVEKDSANYTKWLGKAAAAGNDIAMYVLGFLYDNGRYLPKDSVLAIQWYTKGAEAGNAEAKNNLGIKYSKGRWVEKDYAKALQLFNEAADAGSPYGMFNLATMYMYGRGVPQNNTTALEWFQKAYEKNGAADAAYGIALFYEEGKAGLPKDERAAMDWYQKANRGGKHSGAMQHIGQLYQYGRGVSVDTAEARRWYQQAAALGNAFGMYYLGRMEKDLQTATRWYLQAEHAFSVQINRTINDTESMRGLANLYENGYGVSKNASIAKLLYQRAADWGDEDAREKLKNK